METIQHPGHFPSQFLTRVPIHVLTRVLAQTTSKAMETLHRCLDDNIEPEAHTYHEGWSHPALFFFLLGSKPLASDQSRWLKQSESRRTSPPSSRVETTARSASTKRGSEALSAAKIPAVTARNLQDRTPTCESLRRNIRGLHSVVCPPRLPRENGGHSVLLLVLAFAITCIPQL